MMKKAVLVRNVMCGLLAACALGASQSVWAVEYTNKTIDGNQTINDENFILNNTNYSNNFNVDAYNTKIAITGNDIAITALGKFDNNDLFGVDAWSGGQVTLGNPNAQKICIDVKNEGTRAAKAVVATDKGGSKIDITAKDVSISASSKNAIGVFSLNEGSSISIKGGSVSVTAKGEEAKALQVQNNTEFGDAPDNASRVAIDADKITVTSNDVGIASWSNGQMNIKGNLTVNAKNALDVRGRSTTNINTDGNHSTVLNGDIVFETPATPQNYHNSGNIIDAYVNVNLTGKDSSWTGSAYQEYKTNDADSEYKHVIEMDAQPFQGNVTGFKLTMADGASWNMTGDSFVNDVTASDDSVIHVGRDVKTANMQNVTLNDAAIDLAGDQQTVNVTKKLSGNGTIVTNSLNNKLKAENATDANITVKGTGNIADLIASDSANAQKLADTAVGADGKTIAKDIKASAATIAGDYEAQVDENGNVVNEVKSQNKTNLSISKLGALSLMTWRQENNDMNKRLGEIRDSQGEQGIWARMSRGEAKYGSQGVKNQYNYYQLGYDHKIADDWILGGAFTYTDGENNLVGGNGTNKNTGFAVYGSNLRDDGSFIDLIAKYAHMKNDFDTIGGVGIGEYSTNGYALSAEYGKRFQQDGFWIEPQAELTYGKVSSADFTTSEGAKVHQDSLDSLVGRLGFSLGKDVKAGNIYVRASYLYDFKGDVAMRMSNGVVSDTYDQDLGGSWWEFGVGTNLNFGKDMHFYFDVERTEGGKVDTPWQWNAGVRLSF